MPSGPLSSTRGRVSSTGYFSPIKNPSNYKKHFVQNPLSAAAPGQNKTLKLCQNNVVINTLLLPCCEATPTAGRTFRRRNKRAPLHNSERSLGYGWVSLLEWKRDKGGSIKHVHHILANDLVARLFPS